MKIEEAIETLEEKRKYCKMFYELSANPQEDYPSTAKFMDALELALTALRSMQEAGEPFHIDRSKWKPCEFCNGKTVLYQYTNSTKLFVNTFGGAATLVTECNDCPPYADCCMKDISANSAFRIKFCPECGRPLTEAAWAELERRLRG